MKTPAHSLLGASGAHRWLNCPGSFQLSVAAPARPSSIYAATGTLAHQYIEIATQSALTAGLRPGQVGSMQGDSGTSWDLEGHTITVDQDLIDGVNVMLGYVHRAAHSAATGCGASFRSNWMTTSRARHPPPVVMFGRVDVALLDLQTGILEIIDYKNGAGVFVTVKDNPQLLYYAAGVLRELPATSCAGSDTIKLTVVQPNAPGSEPMRHYEITPVDLLMWVDDVLVPGVEACAQDDPPLVPGPWCRFCPAIHVCPKLQQDANEMAKRDFADHILPEDPAELARNLDTAERAQMWINALQAYALEQLQRQVRVPGWELVPTRPTRKWIEDENSHCQRVENSRRAGRRDLGDPAAVPGADRESLGRRRHAVWTASCLAHWSKASHPASSWPAPTILTPGRSSVMTLTRSDAQIMALKQCITLGRQRVADCIHDLEDALAERDLRTQQDKLVEVVLSLKYTTDFILGDPSP